MDQPIPGQFQSLSDLQQFFSISLCRFAGYVISTSFAETSQRLSPHPYPTLYRSSTCSFPPMESFRGPSLRDWAYARRDGQVNSPRKTVFLQEACLIIEMPIKPFPEATPWIAMRVPSAEWRRR